VVLVSRNASRFSIAQIILCSTNNCLLKQFPLASGLGRYLVLIALVVATTNYMCLKFWAFS
jgi:hypothetical protein